jgi:ABC-type branched-subunit amino acid transport system permease subunit
VYLLYKRFVDSPTGRVCVAIRENEGRARMLGYNTFYFKLAALTLSSLTAALAGFMHTLVSAHRQPECASMGFTVTALLINLIGGVGTLNGALVGATGLPAAGFWSAALHWRKCQFHQWRSVCVVRVLHSVWHCRHMEDEIIPNDRKAGNG